MMAADKTVFLSYRRSVSWSLARAVFMDLRANGWDVFMDLATLDSGQFDQIILKQIAARAHFVILLSPGSVERCAEPDDWLRREIEYAMDMQRNIVPLVADGFTFDAAAPYLTGKLQALSRYNACLLYPQYFDA